MSLEQLHFLDISNPTFTSKMQTQFQPRSDSFRQRTPGGAQRRQYGNRPSYGHQDHNEPQETYQQLMERLYTHADRVVKTRSLREAHEHAAMVFRATRSGNTPRVLFDAGTWTKEDEKPTLTLVQFSDKVQQILRQLRTRQFQIVE